MALQTCMNNDKRSGNSQATLIAVLGDSDPSYHFHYEVGSSLARRTSIEHFCNVRMIEECKGLPLRFEACDHGFGIHPWLDDLQSDFTPDGIRLLGKIGNPAASFAEFLQQPIGTDAIRDVAVRDWTVTDERRRVSKDIKQVCEALEQSTISAAGALEIAVPLGGR